MKKEWPKVATSRQREAAAALVQQLHSKYPGRIGVMALFGSVARGDFAGDSDIDILVVADHVDGNFKLEVRRVGARISLEHEVILNLHIYSEKLWEDARSKRRAIWRNVEQEGIELTPEAALA